MKYENIKELLATICQYNTVRITQTFTKENADWITVICIPNTSTLELTFNQTQEVRQFNSVEEAAKLIESQINSTVNA
ncbi:hypothetical protein [Planococcus sp. YIM B11945]|uniref:hypothetical protein n=1 Tax=Planococcus sp. YIM B11945 TaxID=3435410 RepID=UPI003D7CE74F